ncbi:MAG: MFS transporter [Gammaproteobacteria bacterium]|nr:MFS transporter [Gammaproteobacteria bacterium]
MNEFREGWGTLVAAVIGTMCGLITITNYTQGFFVGPVTQEFGWTPPQFFLGFTVMMCTGLITAPLVGSLAQKYGLKKLGMLGLIGHAIAYFLISLNNGNFIFWLLSWAMLSLLASASLPIIWTAALNGFFKKHRGKAIGITMAGTGIGAFLLPPIVEGIITAYGWRTAYQALGVGALVISLPIVFFLFKQKKGEEVDKGDSANAGWGITRSEALRTPKFWILSAVLFSTVIVVVGLLSNFERIMAGEGLDRATIAGIASIMGITVIFGRLGVGILVDKFWAPAVACVFFALPAIGMYLLLGSEVSYSTAVVVAICIGLAAGAELDMMAYLTGRYFGPRHYPAIFGGIYAAFTVSAGIAPVIFGSSAESRGGYDHILTISIGLLILSMVLFLLLGKYPEQHQGKAA